MYRLFAHARDAGGIRVDGSKDIFITPDGVVAPDGSIGEVEDWEVDDWIEAKSHSARY